MIQKNVGDSFKSVKKLKKYNLCNVYTVYHVTIFSIINNVIF